MFAAILPSVVVAVNCVKQGGEERLVLCKRKMKVMKVRTGMDRNGQELACPLVKTADALPWIARFLLAQLVSAVF